MKDYPFFKAAELVCKCGKCDGGEMVDEFMGKLIAIRNEAGFPMKLSSAYRCPAHNLSVAGTGASGPHTTGRAVDVLVNGRKAHEVLRLAMKHGMTGIGLKQKGPHEARYIHLDDVPMHTGRPTVWTY